MRYSSCTLSIFYLHCFACPLRDTFPLDWDGAKQVMLVLLWEAENQAAGSGSWTDACPAAASIAYYHCGCLPTSHTLAQGLLIFIVLWCIVVLPAGRSSWPMWDFRQDSLRVGLVVVGWRG